MPPDPPDSKNILSADKQDLRVSLAEDAAGDFQRELQFHEAGPLGKRGHRAVQGRGLPDMERTVELERRTSQLSQMASDLTLAEQRAREELAKTLHDGLQQLLVERLE